MGNTEYPAGSALWLAAHGVNQTPKVHTTAFGPGAECEAWLQCCAAVQLDGCETTCVEPLLVVLDLDETLVHAHFDEARPHDFRLGDGGVVLVQVRPGAGEFLQWLGRSRPSIQVAVYTAGSEAYAEGILARIDPQRTLVRRWLSRQDCVPSPIRHVPSKDLTKLGHDLRRTVLVDNNVISFWMQPDNGIHVQDFLGEPVDDNELKRVRGILGQLLGARDVRETLRAKFDLGRVVESVLHDHRIMRAMTPCAQCGMLDAEGGAPGTDIYAGRWFCARCWREWDEVVAKG